MRQPVKPTARERGLRDAHPVNAIARGQLPMASKNPKSLISAYIGAYNRFDVEAMLSLMHPDIVFRNVSGGNIDATATGVDELRELANRSKALFSSRRQVITAFQSAGNSATADIDFEGVLAVDLPNGMKAGEVLRLKGRSEFEFRDGKLSRITDTS